MNTEQENQLFKSLGSIESTQEAILKSIVDIKTDIHKSLETVNSRIDKVEMRVKDVETKTDARLEKVETKVTNTRIKLAASGGAGGLLVLLLAELLKTGGI
ncbi:hypothetical protein [Pseudoalteromonas denitrificans]|uniref:Uncharacterized protein n=1 Tax=Pseudoalteromonas denitrificans DSM 6059 TaxID=1123010 RepID=A0A1I1FZ65_9GAMM|nr:hypothetical protein [Pseudoalteromonas denitrificans]SFC04561.1 hypothetical protein SAMN02745724_00747 [Pseudoalteromonas denitrificans DSM 6059]